MKKTLLGLAVAASFGLGAGAAQAAFLAPGSNGTITVTAGCFIFGVCDIGTGGMGGNGLIDDITDNALTVVGTQSTVGSGVAGNSIVGQMNFTVGANGNSFTLTSYSLDTYTGTAGGNFATMIRTLGAGGAGGTISDTGVVTLNLNGRTGMAENFKNSLREQPWNLDLHPVGGAAAVCAPGSGLVQSFTSGTSTNYDCQGGTGAVNASITGSNLASAVPLVPNTQGTWTGTLVSAGNVGGDWGAFDGTPYTEIYNVTVIGTVPSTVGTCTPTAFAFTPQTTVGLSQTITSNSQTIAGITAPTCPISVVNGAYEIGGSGTWTSTAGTVSAGQTVRVRHTSSAQNLTSVVTDLTVGTVTRPFTSTTLPPASVCRSNFTMIDTGGGITGGSNDVIVAWNGTSTTNNNSTVFTNMTLSSATPFFGANWTAHHIRVFGPGTYTFNTNCSTTDLETTGTCTTGGAPPLTMTVGTGQIGAHILFNWSQSTNIDVVNVWDQNSMFSPSPMYTGQGGNRARVWELASTDANGDGKNGVPMVDGDFIGYNANFNLSGYGLSPTGQIVTCVTNIPPPMQSEDTNVGSRLNNLPGCSLSAGPVNPLERGDWWLLLGFVAWMGFVARRKRMMQ